VSKNDLETVLWYRLVKKAVSERADIKATIQAALLKALGEAAGTASPWHDVIAKGSFSLEVLVHERKHSAVGLAMYQLAIVPAAESMSGSSPALAATMGAIKANMTAGWDAAEGPQYFTLRDRDPSGRITLAPVPGRSSRKGPFDTRDETDRMETEETVEAPMVGRMMSAAGPSSGVTAPSKKRGRESTEV
jgi:hypothetical protein